MDTKGLSALADVLKALTDLAIKPLNVAKEAVETAKQVVQSALDSAKSALDSAQSALDLATKRCNSASKTLREKKEYCGDQQAQGWAGLPVDGNARAKGGGDVTVDDPFVPEVCYDNENDLWAPICGHWFCDNDNGANTICKTLGFAAGHTGPERKKILLDSYAMPVGRCNADQTLGTCDGGGNHWMDLQRDECKPLHKVGVQVVCTGPADVRAENNEAVTAGVAFVPEVKNNGNWFPICGHWFKDNNFRAATICKTLGFSGGTQEETDWWSSGAMKIGKCNYGEPLDACNAGDNQWGTTEECSISVKVTCTGKTSCNLEKSTNGKCGSDSGEKACSDASNPYCSNNGWCGNTDVHKNDEQNDKYDFCGDFLPTDCLPDRYVN